MRRLLLASLLVLGFVGPALTTARGRQWYATTVRSLLDRAGVEGVKEAA